VHITIDSVEFWSTLSRSTVGTDPLAQEVPF